MIVFEKIVVVVFHFDLDFVVGFPPLSSEQADDRSENNDKANKDTTHWPVASLATPREDKHALAGTVAIDTVVAISVLIAWSFFRSLALVRAARSPRSGADPLGSVVEGFYET